MSFTGSPAPSIYIAANHAKRAVESRPLPRDWACDSSVVPYSRPPAWRYFPPTDSPPTPLAEVAAAFIDLTSWFKEDFWRRVDSGQKIETKEITKQLEAYLLVASPAVSLDSGLHAGWNVETRDRFARIPLLYGENGKALYGVEPDAIFARADGYRALLEIEGGGAVQNNRLMKDVVETLLIPGAHHLALAVPHVVHGRSPYDFAVNLIEALYARQVPQDHVDGVLIIGY